MPLIPESEQRIFDCKVTRMQCAAKEALSKVSARVTAELGENNLWDVCFLCVVLTVKVAAVPCKLETGRT